MNQEDLLRKILRDNGYSITRQRQLVFELLRGQEPQSIHSLVRRSAGTVDRVSIYRIIELFEKLGIVNRITIGWKYKLELSEVFLDHHHHLSCLRCGKIIAIKDHAIIEAAIDKFTALHHFTQTTHQLEIQGYCVNCQPLTM